MSDYHVRQIREDGREANVVFHIPIPVENNGAGVPLRTALSEQIKPRLEDGTFGIFQSQLQGITAGELIQLQTGELSERAETVSFLAADTNAQKQAKIDDRYTKLTTSALNIIRTRLKFWGLDRNVP